MITVKGKYNSASVYTYTVEETALHRIERLCDMEAFKDSSIAIMPDMHADMDCAIGTTMTLNGHVVPSMVDVDIG